MDDKLKKYKKDITKKYKKYSNEELLQLHNDKQYDKIIESMLPMVINLTKKYCYLDSYDDIVSVGNESLINSVMKFDQTKTTGTIISYVRTILAFDVINYLRDYENMIKYPNKYEQNKKLNIKMVKTNLDTVMDYLYDDNIIPSYQEKRSEIKDLLLKLPRVYEYQVDIFLDYYYGDNMTNQKLADKYEYSKSNISLIMVNLTKKINKNEKVKNNLKNILNF
jgi:RNA polymerase sigma factor (sigma-70 family)